MRAVFILLALMGTARAERRYLLALGQNHGEPEEESLRFAEADAEAVRNVMVSLGGVRPGDATLVRGGTADDLRAALARLQSTLRHQQAGSDDVLFIYVSSHAADGALHLQGTAFPLAELRHFVEAAPVGTAVLIADTCHAAWITRNKGLAPLTDRTVVLEPTPVTGRVFIASAGPFEPAQESDRLGGSYFTHHLVAGLRGVADRSADGQVSLWEAFAYAHAQTLEGTLGSRGGRQTPRFEVQLEGQRELVLTELHRGRALLTLTPQFATDWAITALEGNRRTVRFSSKGPMVFSMDPGTYRIRASTGDGAVEQAFELADGAALTVSEADLAGWHPAEGRSKGGSAGVAIRLGARGGTAAVEGADGPLPGFLVGIGWLSGRLEAGAQAGMRFGEVAGADGSAFSQKEVDLAGYLTYQPGWLPVLRAGLEAGTVLVLQRGTPRGDRTQAVPRLGAVLGVRPLIGEGAFLEFAAAAGGQYTQTFAESRLVPYLAGTASLGLVIDP